MQNSLSLINRCASRLPSFFPISYASVQNKTVASPELKPLASSGPQSSTQSPETQPNLAPQICAGNDKDISLILPRPSLKNISFPGGGASAVAIPFALSQINLDSVESFAGASGGGLVALLVASGCEPLKLAEILGEGPLENYLGTVPHFNELYPDIVTVPAKTDLNFLRLTMHILRMAFMTVFLKHWQKKAEGAIQFMDRLSSKSVYQYLKETTNWDKCVAAHQACKINNQQLNRLTFLKNSLWFTEPTGQHTSRIPYMITFADLELLHSIEPTKFKKLILVTSTIKPQNTDAAPTTTEVTRTILSAQHSPDMPIAFAGRTSMSIPFYFESTGYKGQFYWDGATTDRVPADILWEIDNPKNSIDQAKAHAQTLVLDFRSLALIDTLSPVLYKNVRPGPDQSLPIKAVSWFIGCPDYKTYVGQENRIIHDAGPNLLPIHNKRIGPFNMTPSKEEFDETAQATLEDTKRYLDIRKNEAYYLTFHSVVDAWNSLDDAQKAQVREDGDPRLDPDFEKLPLRTQYAQSAFYALAASSAQVQIPDSKETQIGAAPQLYSNPIWMSMVKDQSARLFHKLTAPLITSKALSSISTFFTSWLKSYKA